MFQFSIREVLWLTLVVALATGWLIHARSEQTDDQFLQIQLMEQRLQDTQDLILQLQAVKEQNLAAAASHSPVVVEASPASVEPADASESAPLGRHVRIVHRRLMKAL
jgi:hypothetical protein